MMNNVARIAKNKSKTREFFVITALSVFACFRYTQFRDWPV